MARKKRKSHFKSHRKSRRGIGGFGKGKISNLLTEGASLGAGAIAGKLAISKLPFPKSLFGFDTKKFAGLKAVAAGVAIKMLVPKSGMADLAAKGAIAVGVAEVAENFGVAGIYGDPLQGFDLEDVNVNGVYDRAEGEYGSPLQGTEDPGY